LTSDFGLQDPFVGIMKAVIFRQLPDARLIDLTHEIPAGSVLHAGLALRAAIPWFPAGSVHLCVVDPQVGSERAVLIFAADWGYLVTPDNGVVGLLGRQLRPRNCFRVPAKELPSHTFHGRDIFAPLAARLAAGQSACSLGEPIGGASNDSIFQPRRLHIPPPRKCREGLLGRILAFDRFGNAITNLPANRCGHLHTILLAEQPLPRHPTYSAAPPGRAFFYEGSAGWLELALPMDSLQKRLGLREGMKLLGL
jgi:S-adenosylmethionine hydrolase